MHSPGPNFATSAAFYHVRHLSDVAFRQITLAFILYRQFFSISGTFLIILVKRHWFTVLRTDHAMIFKTKTTFRDRSCIERLWSLELESLQRRSRKQYCTVYSLRTYKSFVAIVQCHADFHQGITCISLIVEIHVSALLTRSSPFESNCRVFAIRLRHALYAG